jgi:hypothetical protein
MGEAWDDLFDHMDRMDTFCKKHKIWFEDTGFGCPKCEWESDEQTDQQQERQES